MVKLSFLELIAKVLRKKNVNSTKISANFVCVDGSEVSLLWKRSKLEFMFTLFCTGQFICHLAFTEIIMRFILLLGSSLQFSYSQYIFGVNLTAGLEEVEKCCYNVD